jgi:hypothetical protein
MTPHDIKVLLHHHSCRDAWPLGSTEAYRRSLEWAWGAGLLDRQDSLATTTPRGAALVAMLCSTPLPETAFVNPLTGKVVEDR